MNVTVRCANELRKTKVIKFTTLMIITVSNNCRQVFSGKVKNVLDFALKLDSFKYMSVLHEKIRLGYFFY